MHPVITRLLKKRGINSIRELFGAERDDVTRWQGILSKGEVTVEGVVEFCNKQINQIERKWKDLDNDPKKNERLIQQHTVYKAIRDIIERPQAEKVSLEKYLESLI